MFDKSYKQEPRFLAKEEEITSLTAQYKSAADGFKLLSEDEGGDIKSVLQAALANGVCLEKQVNSQDYALSEHRDAILDGAKSRGMSVGKSDTLLNLLSDLWSPVSSENAESECKTANVASKMFRDVAVNDLEEILHKSADPVSDMLMKACHAKIKIPHFEEHGETDSFGTFVRMKKIYPNRKDEDFFNEIDKNLEKGGPVGILYDHQILFKSKALGRSPLSDHASVLVGKQYDCKKHEIVYLLRNSWGKSCESIRSEYRSLSENSPEIKAIFSAKSRCLEGCEGREEKISCQDQCFSKERELMLRTQRPPYECTPDGYYLMPRSELADSNTSFDFIEY